MRGARLRGWLAASANKNAQGEYYLTDIMAMAVKDGIAVRALAAPAEVEVLGVNDRVQLARLGAVLRARRAQAALLAGATLADPARFDLRGTGAGPRCVHRRQRGVRRPRGAGRSRARRRRTACCAT